MNIQFKEKELNDKTLSFKNELQRGVFVSVHIRRGDYLNNVGRFGLCELSYYREAIKYIKSIVDNPKFVFFSDDMAWAKDNIDNDEAVFVSWNQGKDSWQDMYLMSHCQHNIVANSSFSWWGAWLNGNPHKVVVAPKKWFMYSPNYDIIPDNWITI